jgi:MFS family permease
MTQSTSTGQRAARTGASRSGHRLPPAVAFWTTAAVFLAAMSFTTVPTPLYALYASRDGFPTWVTTVVFAAYAVGVAVGLYFFGHVSDWYGRRPLALAALVAELAAAVVFILWPSVPGLLVARVLTGLGVGGLTAAATAHLGELRSRVDPDHSGRLSGAVATFANIGGLGLGPLIGGLFAQFLPDPLVTPYVVALVVLALAAVVMLATPETVRKPDPRPAYRPQRLAVPPEGRGTFWAAGAGVFAAFAIFGLFTALAPTFLAQEFHDPSRLVAGAVPFAVFASAAVTQVVLQGLRLRVQLVIAIVAMVVGLAGLAVSAIVVALWLFVVSGIVAGAGVGLLFRGSLGVAGSLVDPGRRGEALAGMFLIAYIGLTVPVLAVGVVIALVSPVVTLVVFAALIAVGVLIAGSRMVRRAS